jgi:hypothetical protein
MDRVQHIQLLTRQEIFDALPHHTFNNAERRLHATMEDAICNLPPEIFLNFCLMLLQPRLRSTTFIFLHCHQIYHHSMLTFKLVWTVTFHEMYMVETRLLRVYYMQLNHVFHPFHFVFPVK